MVLPCIAREKSRGDNCCLVMYLTVLRELCQESRTPLAQDLLEVRRHVPDKDNVTFYMTVQSELKLRTTSEIHVYLFYTSSNRHSE